jgi:hypothetical protein
MRNIGILLGLVAVLGIAVASIWGGNNTDKVKSSNHKVDFGPQRKADQCVAGFNVKLDKNNGNKLVSKGIDTAHPHHAVKQILKYAKHDPRILQVYWNASPLGKKHPVKDAKSLTKNGCYTAHARDLYNQLLAEYKTATVKKSSVTYGRNTGAYPNGNAFQESAGAITGDTRAVRIKFSNGDVIYALHRCGNVVTKTKAPIPSVTVKPKPTPPAQKPPTRHQARAPKPKPNRPSSPHRPNHPTCTHNCTPTHQPSCTHDCKPNHPTCTHDCAPPPVCTLKPKPGYNVVNCQYVKQQSKDCALNAGPGCPPNPSHTPVQDNPRHVNTGPTPGAGKEPTPSPKGPTPKPNTPAPPPNDSGYDSGSPSGSGTPGGSTCDSSGCTGGGPTPGSGPVDNSHSGDNNGVTGTPPSSGGGSSPSTGGSQQSTGDGHISNPFG